jgi:hypothetical protein
MKKILLQIKELQNKVRKQVKSILQSDGSDDMQKIQNPNSF